MIFAFWCWWGFFLGQLLNNIEIKLAESRLPNGDKQIICTFNAIWRACQLFIKLQNDLNHTVECI